MAKAAPTSRPRCARRRRGTQPPPRAAWPVRPQLRRALHRVLRTLAAHELLSPSALAAACALWLEQRAAAAQPRGIGRGLGTSAAHAAVIGALCDLARPPRPVGRMTRALLLAPRSSASLAGSFAYGQLVAVLVLSASSADTSAQETEAAQPGARDPVCELAHDLQRASHSCAIHVPPGASA
ncbi:hypothetical protein T492DRAFT_1027405 [Pavlovales sp. CCMP2436]|nr:hypothetical protein T492DRAFT_1027405 [Pavlovales sp. CCMP2436]